MSIEIPQETRKDQIKGILRPFVPRPVWLRYKSLVRFVRGERHLTFPNTRGIAINGIEAYFYVQNSLEDEAVAALGYEREFITTEFLPLLKRGVNFCDVGASSGIYSVFAGILGANVTALEPDPECAASLTTNLRNNLIESYRVLNTAAWSTEGLLQLRTNGAGGETHLG